MIDYLMKLEKEQREQRENEVYVMTVTSAQKKVAVEEEKKDEALNEKDEGQAYTIG